ncbi:TrbC/VirB2 family protein [Paenibacillus sediminis]|uniref:Type IV secretory pathway VirB2 component (Pilin) n=1 Tax=Paenibacillus sediminis TaxID=664909 RepID=A0ABS4H812_9BACL|nr:TrbC/VirB2 family protein [Paenibacillus sediminis]MBP1938215.1 type IV secretory pathway VirB2 component (pilin) [Paenibacillus sediminis]
MKTVTLEWGAFMDGSIVTRENAKHLVTKTASAVHLALIPKTALASAVAGSQTWSTVFSTVLGIADWLCVGIIVYAGITWMFGNRTKAIEFLMGGGIGYIIVRHAVDIRNWLRTL